MSPGAFREFVTPYERPIADFMNRHRVLLNCHCHSMIRDALPAMVDAGMSATDPVEPPPMGNVTAASAGPISRMSPELIRNYHEWVDAALEYGECDSSL